MKLLIVEDITEDFFGYDANILRAKLGDCELRTVKPEISLSVALLLLDRTIEEFAPDIIIGIGTGGMLVHQKKLKKRILVRPSFYASERLELSGLYDENLIEEYRDFESTQFDHVPDNDWQFMYAWFERRDDISPEEHCFKQRYKYNYYSKQGYTWADDKEEVLSEMVKELMRQNEKPEKKIVYIDMDNVLVDFRKLSKELEEKNDKEFLKYRNHIDDIPHLFSRMEPMEGAVEAFKVLAEHFDVYILSTAPWDNYTAWSDKVEWVKRHLGPIAYKRLILSHHKNLNAGDYLIDDSSKNGAKEFGGEWIQFGKEPFENWDKVLKYLCKE